jgi:hypothetical protein
VAPKPAPVAPEAEAPKPAVVEKKKSNPVPIRVGIARTKKKRDIASVAPSPVCEEVAEVATRDIAQVEEFKNPELVLEPKFSYGGKYVSLKQSGAFGGGQGSGIAVNYLAFETKVSYDKWNFAAFIERYSIDLNRDSLNTTLRETKTIKTISLKPGYGIFFTGIEVKTTPFMQVSGTSIQWGDVNTVSALGGVRFEKEFSEGRKKPFKAGVESQIDYALSGSGNGPTITSASGLGFEVKAHAEKALMRREDYELNYGVVVQCSAEQLKIKGTWNTATGETKQTNWITGASFYFGAKF